MIYTNLTKQAMRIAYENHLGQIDKSGIPYIYHPIHLAEQMNDEDTTIVALLHDVIEDADTTIDELKTMGLSSVVLEALKVLTKLNSVDYFDYIDLIKNNKLATQVKIEDLKHNLDLTRLDLPTEEDYLRIEKYKKALKILENQK